MSTATKHGADPFGYAENYDDARHDPGLQELAGPEGQRAAYRLAVAIGYCRITNTSPLDDGVLPLDGALAASAECRRVLARLLERARSLGATFDSTIEPLEYAAEARGLVSIRQDTWAAGIALGEAYDTAHADGDPDPERLGVALEGIYQLLEQIDESLLGQIGLLTGVASGHFLKNARTMLAEHYRSNPPWWLDGRIERAATNAERDGVEALRGLTRRSHATPVTAVNPSSYTSRQPRPRALDRETQTLAAATENSTVNGNPKSRVRWFKHPGGQYFARVHTDKNGDIVAQIYQGEEKAQRLEETNRTLRLQNAVKPIDPDGRAVFAAAEVATDVAELHVSFGDEPMPWGSSKDPSAEVGEL